MAEKQCSTCKKTKPVAEFDRTKAGKVAARCKGCRRASVNARRSPLRKTPVDELDPGPSLADIRRGQADAERRARSAIEILSRQTEAVRPAR